MPHFLPANAHARAAFSLHTSTDLRGRTARTVLLLGAWLLSSLIVPLEARAATFILAPTADSYISSGAATSNFGTQSTLQVGTSPTRWAYLMFNVQGLTGPATSASLRLWAVTGGGSTAKTAASTWTETGITYNNKPAPNASPTKTATSSTGTYVTYDVTGFYTSNGNWTFVFSSAAGATFASREDAAHAPQLTVIGPGGSTVPGAPTSATASPGNGQATVNWTIPASDGGSPILNYTVTSTPGGFTATASGATATSATVSGLTNGTSYTFTVHATNGIGTGPESVPSNAVSPGTVTVPGPPTNVSAAPSNAQATVNWIIPASNGGSAIASYTATSTPGGITATVSGATATSVIVSGLTNGTSYTFTVHATNGIGSGPESAASNAVMPSATPPAIHRRPYLTDTTTTSTLVNYATSAGGSPLPIVRWDLASGNCANPPNTATVTTLMATLSGLPAGTSYQYKTLISGLAADTAYCYRVYQNGVDLNGVATTFRTALPSGSATPFKFAVIGDWGQGTTDQAGVAAQIAAANPNLLLTVGDNVYASGSQSEYGDLSGGNVFPAQFLPTMGSGLPIFAAQGNHGFTSNSAYLQNFPQDTVASAPGEKFQSEAYSGIPGSSNATYASSWFAFTWGRARFYVLEAAWSDSNGGYSGDYQAHWNTANSGCTPACGAELTWLQSDLAANASVPLKFAFFHYPLYSDSPSEVTDTFLDGASPRLEGVLADAGVNLVFTGHSHQYERNVVQAGGPRIVNYITGGGGAALGSLSSCDPWDAYAIAGSSHCGAAPASNPPSSFHFLLVSVNGNQVTVTPIDKTGLAFDVQTYTFGATPPAAPTGLTATSGNNQVSLAWNSSSGATGYNLYRGTATGAEGGTPLNTSPVNATTYTDTGLTNGTTYYYVVRAVNAAGESANSTEVSATPQPPAPAAPSGLSGSTTAGDQPVTLSWTAPGGPVDSYNLKRGTSSTGPFSTISAPGSVTVTSYSDSSALSGTTYYYVVSAVNGGGESANSGPSSAITLRPAQPSGLVATPGNSQVSLSWTAPTGATGYNLYRGTATAAESSTPLNASPVIGTSYTDSTAANGTAYFYLVKAVNGGGESGASNEASATPQPQPQPPAAPTGLTPTSGNNQVGLSWNASAGATGYNVYRGTTSGIYGASALNGGAPLMVTSFNDITAVNGTTYYYVVRALNDAGSSGNSNQAVATPQPPTPAAPTGLTATPGNNQVALSWTAPAGPVTSYNVKRGTVSGGPYTTISTPGIVTTTSSADSTALNGTTYYYVVSAVNGGGEGPNSTQASATPTGTRTFVFSDGFETGNLSKWTTMGGLTVQSTVKRTGTYAAQGNTTNGATYAKKLLATTYTNGYFRIWFYLASGYSAQVNVLRYRAAADASMGYLFVSATGRLSMKSDISAVTTTSVTSVTSNAWHALELHLVVNGTSSSTEVWLDNVKINDLSLTGQDWGATPIGKVQIGEVQSGRTYNVTFDDVAFDTAQIGLLPVP